MVMGTGDYGPVDLGKETWRLRPFPGRRAWPIRNAVENDYGGRMKRSKFERHHRARIACGYSVSKGHAHRKQLRKGRGWVEFEAGGSADVAFAAGRLGFRGSAGGSSCDV